VQPDIVLMDIIMPKMGGIEATRRILRQYPKARILMISSVGYQENISAALQSGAQHFLQKPIKPEALCEAIQLMLAAGRPPVSAATAAIGAKLLIVIAHSATPHKSLYLRMCCVPMILSPIGFICEVACYKRRTGSARSCTVAASVDQPRLSPPLAALSKSNMSNRSPMAGLFTGRYGLSLSATGSAGCRGCDR